MQKPRFSVFTLTRKWILIAMVITLGSLTMLEGVEAENISSSGDSKVRDFGREIIRTYWSAEIIPGNDANPDEPIIKPGVEKSIKLSNSALTIDTAKSTNEPAFKHTPLWEGLQAFSEDDKVNGVLQLEFGNGFPKIEAEALMNAENLWNNGSFNQAVEVIRNVEEAGFEFAIGISWKTPRKIDSPDWKVSDVQIGTRTNVKDTHLDSDKETGNVFAVLRYFDQITSKWWWSVNISKNKGNSWEETYTWGNVSYEIRDISAAVADDFLWVGYIDYSTFDEGKIRRFNVSDGSVDGSFNYKTIIDKSISIKEISVKTNTDGYDNRVYYWAILEEVAPPDSAISHVAEPENSIDQISAAQVPIDMGNVEVLAPMVPGSFDGDLRNLPKAVEEFRGPPIEIPEGQLPDGSGDGWERTDPIEPTYGENDASNDPVLDTGEFAHGDSFTSNVDFEGLGYTSVAPPDTVGDVGPNHYIQMINHYSGSQFQIWDKNGTSLVGPTVLDTLWTGGGNCASGKGDPIVVYDPLADRWLMSEFANSGYHLCIYISKTSDPVSGGWWLYDFSTPAFPDYPKYGVWPDAYYVSTYEGSSLGVYALDRTNMLEGNAATSQRFSISALSPSSSGSCSNARSTRILPSDLDGPAPPSGSPNYFFRSVEQCQDVSNPTDRIEIYEFDVNWSTPSSSTFSLVSTVTPAAFTMVSCTPDIRDCIPQPDTTRMLDALSNRPLHRLQYRNFGSYETLVTNQAVDSTLANSGIRWYEMRRTSGVWSIHQQGTYSPDSNDRWMGSIAMDSVGNMALGYSVASSSVYPSIRYTGRQANDSLGVMTESEVTMMAGSGSQTWSSRWGDYSAMSVDPTDDCTFWYTQQYMPANGQWATRVGSFSFASCTEASNLVYYWAYNIESTTPVWNEDPTGVKNAFAGLDSIWKEYDSGSYHSFACYLAEDGNDKPVMISRHSDSSWDTIEISSNHTGSHDHTSISAYQDTVICAYEKEYTSSSDEIEYRISYNSGDSWLTGGWLPDSGQHFMYPDVTARGGKGLAMVYSEEAGSWDPVHFRYRDHYSPGGWDEWEINSQDNFTGTPNRIEWLYSKSTQNHFGMIYLSDPGTGTPYFDRFDLGSISLAPINILLLSSD